MFLIARNRVKTSLFCWWIHNGGSYVLLETSWDVQVETSRSRRPNGRLAKTSRQTLGPDVSKTTGLRRLVDVRVETCYRRLAQTSAQTSTLRRLWDIWARRLWDVWARRLWDVLVATSWWTSGPDVSKTSGLRRLLDVRVETSYIRLAQTSAQTSIFGRLRDVWSRRPSRRPLRRLVPAWIVCVLVVL